LKEADLADWFAVLHLLATSHQPLATSHSKVFHAFIGVAPRNEATMNTTQTTAIEPGCRIRLPEDWAQSLGMQGQVVLIRTNDGILVRPHPLTTWDEVFADKLRVRPGDDSVAPEVEELSGDDTIFF
jgi:hypothetical protein